MLGWAGPSDTPGGGPCLPSEAGSRQGPGQPGGSYQPASLPGKPVSTTRRVRSSGGCFPSSHSCDDLGAVQMTQGDEGAESLLRGQLPLSWGGQWGLLTIAGKSCLVTRAPASKAPAFTAPCPLQLERPIRRCVESHPEGSPWKAPARLPSATNAAKSKFGRNLLHAR